MAGVPESNTIFMFLACNIQSYILYSIFFFRVTSVLVPWNTCGAFMSQTLGVATLTYAPFVFFNILNPFVAAAYGAIGIGIHRLQEPPPEGTRRHEVDLSS